jgi:release factor glutamine methyltransferase
LAVDLSGPALAVARRNARAHGVDDRIVFVRGDFTDPILEKGRFDLIVSNPPYVTDEEYARASREVTGFEPRTALVSGPDGLDHVRALLPRALEALRRGGLLLMEIGCGQAEGVKIITLNQCLESRDVGVIKDLAGHDRVVSMRRA